MATPATAVPTSPAVAAPGGGGAPLVASAAKPGNKFAGPLDGSQFDMGVTLGTGSFGRVRFATHKVGLYCSVYGGRCCGVY